MHLLSAGALLVLCAIHVTAAGAAVREAVPKQCSLDIRRGILWGTGTGAYSVEGAALSEGRTACVWDAFVAASPSAIAGASNASVAADVYRRWRSDVLLLKELGVQGFRFSISWSRLLPGAVKGSPVNPKAVAFYGALLDALREAGITPLVALYHWDLPQRLHEAYGGFTSGRVVEDFAHFADTAFRLFGARVPLWLTFVEPWVVCNQQYGDGSWAPGVDYGDAGRYACGHNVLLAHARAAALYRARYQKAQRGRLSFSSLVTWPVPASGAAADKRAAQNKLDAEVGWFLDPIFKGDYPPSLRARKRLPDFTPEQRESLNASLDYIAASAFTATFVRAAPGNAAGWRESKVLPNGTRIGPPTGIPWMAEAPLALREAILYLHRTYPGLDLLVPSSGTMALGEAALRPPEALRDPARQRYLASYLGALCEAVRAGAPVVGWFAWSFLDSWEWVDGYRTRFGLVHVDYAGGSLARSPKDSARWLAEHFFRVRRRSAAGGV